MKKIVSTVLFLSIFITLHTFSQTDSTKIARKTGDHSYAIDNIKINTETREVTFSGWVNMQKGLVEVIACAPGGKDHESVLIADITPSYLNSALLLLGLERSPEVSYDLKNPNIVGPEIEIYVSWNENGEKVNVAAEELLYNVYTKEPAGKIKWIYVGSFSRGGRYAADDAKSIITTYLDHTTIIENGSESGYNDELFEANPDVVPEKYTDVIITLKVK